MARKTTTQPRIFTPDEAAITLAIGRTSIYKLVREGKLRAVRVPGISGIRIRSEDIDAYLRNAVAVAPAMNDGRPKRSRSRARSAA